MSSDFLKELKWRGLIHDISSGVEDQLNQEMTTGYIGFDPTADSLHIGNLIPIIILMHFQRSGHKPVAILGGATGMIGDPSGKSKERNLLDEKTVEKNAQSVKRQLEKFLDFDPQSSNGAELFNNYDWMKDISLIDFVRNIGKHLAINYMIAKDSVKKRISSEKNEGMSFTEFTYQLFQAYDFLHLYQTENCKLQMGGADQWGNITTGIELIRRKLQKKSYAITCPLITKSDGTKFGKSEEKNIWLDREKTSVYEFYQYWINISDEDAVDFIKKFTFLSREEIDRLVLEHDQKRHLRILQKKLAEEITTIVHSKRDCEKAERASSILFGESTAKDLISLDEQTFLVLFEGIPQAIVEKKVVENGYDIILAFSESGFAKSNAEVRRLLRSEALSVNKIKVNERFKITMKQVILEKYILLQKGKKNYFLLIVI